MKAMKAVCIKTKTHDEWLACRRGGIGSSDVATILGLNPFSTPYQLWLSRREPEIHESENELMLLGHCLEDAIAKRWAIATGKEIIKSSADEWIYIHPEKDYFRASPDRIFWDEPDNRRASNRCILEIKSTQKDIDPDNFPKYWWVQVQWQLHVMGLQKANLAWLTRGRDFGYIEILKNEEFCEWMAGEVEKFWNDNIIGGQEPAPISSSDVMKKFSGSVEGKSVEVNEDILNTCNQLKGLKEEIDVLEEKKKELEERIKVAFLDAETLTFGGKTIATWKSAKPSNKFDTTAFKAAQPELYAQFCKETPGARRFNVK